MHNDRAIVIEDAVGDIQIPRRARIVMKGIDKHAIIRGASLRDFGNAMRDVKSLRPVAD